MYARRFIVTEHAVEQVFNFIIGFARMGHTRMLRDVVRDQLVHLIV